MAVKQGDFLLVNYTLKVKESGETVDTTIDSVAKDARIHREDAAYTPKFIILGEGWLPKGLEESLVGIDLGKPTTIEIPPEKGYGPRDPGKMRLVPLRRFRDKGLDPIPGVQVEFEGKPAVVRAVGAGRVQVDYNHPLAGRTLVYDVSVEKVVEDEQEKILNIIARRIPEVAKEKFVLVREGGELTIEVPEEAFYLSGLQVAKKAVTSDLQKYFPELHTMSFREIFKKTPPKAEEVTAPQPITTPPGPETLEAETLETEARAEVQAAQEKAPTPTVEKKKTSGRSTRRRSRSRHEKA